MNFGRFPSGRPAPDKPLLTLGDVERWQDELRELKQQRKELDQRIEGLERRLTHAQLFVSDLAASEIAKDVPEGESLGHAADSPGSSKEPELVFRPKTAPRTELTFNAYKVMREIALRLAAERETDGFEAKEIYRQVQEDPTIPDRIRAMNQNYIYTVLKRLQGDKLIAKVGSRYLAYANVPPVTDNKSGPATPEGTEIAGYKLVPMTKEERIREESRKYLMKRANKTAHRAQIADHMVGIGVMGTEKATIKSLAVYYARWEEFVANGDGTYTLKEPEKTNGDS
jgi:DNA-binding PadR family transcriptional regulator